MAEPLNLRGRWTLITGASAGLGAEMARAIARDHGGHVVAVARRLDRLEALRAEVETKYGTKLVAIAADMCRPEDVERTFVEATQGREIYAAVLNAGVTFYGEILDQPRDSFDAMLATNVTSVVRLATRFAGYMAERDPRGAIMLVSSMAGFTPMPYQGTYAATKAFVTSFGRSLALEVRDRGVSVTVFAPGGIATEMLELSGLSRKFKAGDFGIMPADVCAGLALRALVRRRELYVPGFFNQVGAVAVKLTPHSFVLRRLASVYREERTPLLPAK